LDSVEKDIENKVFKLNSLNVETPLNNNKKKKRGCVLHSRYKLTGTPSG